MQPPTAVGEYTIVVEVAQSPNYEAGSAQADFAVSLARAELSVSIEGWTYGEAPNEPTVSAASDSEVTLRYTGTANDGTAWDSSEAPSKAGDYTLTATIIAGGNYAGEDCLLRLRRCPCARPCAFAGRRRGARGFGRV